MISIIKKNNAFLYSLFALALFVTSCTADQEPYLGDSNATPTSPQITITTDVTNLSLIEDDSSYSYTVEMSTAQLVDTHIAISQIGGDATEGEDFSIDHTIVISAGSTTGSGTITILSDEILEDTETVTIQVGDNSTANASLTPQTMTFTILNVTEGDLVIDLGWASAEAATDDSGNDIAATDLADLRLLITNVPYTQILDEADGDAFETYVLTADKPDGEYYVVADFYASNGMARNLNLDLEYNQVGLINHDAYSYSAALFNCPANASNYYIMSKVTKAGTNYTIEYVGEAAPYSVDQFVGSYTELSDADSLDWLTEDLSMSLGDDENEIMITGIFEGLFTLAWGEVFQPGFGNEGIVSAIFSPDNSMEIPSQYMGQTLPGPYDYWMLGEGFYDPCADEVSISFDLYFDDTTSGSWRPNTVVVQKN